VARIAGQGCTNCSAALSRKTGADLSTRGWRLPFRGRLQHQSPTHTHILKPDPRAYALALEGLDLPANEVVFIDDQPRNVAGGSAVGIRSFHMDITNPLESIARVRLAMSL
jgi:phosphoglycolate phosphatase-like HAD superfamily hydrolase